MAQPRLLMVPGGLSEEVVRRTLRQNLWLRVKPRPKHVETLYAAVCDDARNTRSKCVKEYLRQLLADVIEDRGLQVNSISFHDADVDRHINRCDVFMMAGCEPNRFLELLTRYPKPWQDLCDRVRTGDVMYIGSCGGAVMCGRYYHPNMETQLLNFLNVNITVSDSSEDAARMPSEKNGITFINMTKKTAILVQEPEAKSFICTTSGVAKYKKDAVRITEILRRYSTWIPLETVQAPPSPPRHDSEVAALAERATPAVAATAVTPSLHLPFLGVTNRWAITDNYVPRASRTRSCRRGRTRKVKHKWPQTQTLVVKKFMFKSNDKVLHHYLLYTMSTGMTEKVVVYLPSTKLEPPNNHPNNPKQVPHWWTGEATVFVPEIEAQGATPKWRNEMPTWIPEWVRFCRSCAPMETQWSLMGFSRGASWGLSLLSQPDVTFHKVLLVAPYMLPRWEELELHRAQILSALRVSGPRARLVWGARDEWLGDCLMLIRQASNLCDVQCAWQCNHDESLIYVYSQGWWAWLIA